MKDIPGIIVMKSAYTAVVKRDGEWWIRWIEEVPGVNSQGATREEFWSIYDQRYKKLWNRNQKCISRKNMLGLGGSGF